MAKLYFYYSAMNAGKSTALLQSSYNYHERGMQTVLFTPEIDTRYERGKIHSRIGLEAEAILFNDQTNMLAIVTEQQQYLPKLRCVLIDEAQFLSRDQVQQLTSIADELGIPVLAFGLRSDFRGDIFPGSLYLLAWAEELIELKTICHCGKKATMNMRIDERGNAVHEGAQVEIGGNDRYIATCRKCFKAAKNQSLTTNLKQETEITIG